ncbi:hypothetical protein GLX30_07590 [Streptomyces sp. Tu 2975]|uniref:hypothetical protein n=1 Tax=Streptomyces sp. Tu 2975 TaxID=2676871 RepID=UPI00135AEB22|nr:hypothetical protein [Streptomyces sp. Tu 2975]QIP83937.1 hypothetical protein GLX30_07590 [Streptomyces sp. Tu 2975]
MTENRSGDAVGPAAPPQASPQPQVPATSRQPTLDELLAAAARPGPVAPDAEENALAAFRAARDEGALALPTRPEDDWRPAEARTRVSWIRAGVGALVAGVMFGGVAMAAGAIPAPFADPPAEQPRPAPRVSPSGAEERTTGVTPPATMPAVPPATVPGAHEHPLTAEDLTGHCRAYAAAQAAGRNHDKPGGGNANGGKANGGNANGGKADGREADGGAKARAVRERLAAVAGGPDRIEAYCARMEADRPAGPAGEEHGPESGVNAGTDAPSPEDPRAGPDKWRAPIQKPSRQ